MNLVSSNSGAVHADNGARNPKCMPTGRSNLGGFSTWDYTSKSVTCKRCLKK